MLKELHIYNIMLMESAQVNFQEGLNVITGETGSGKSALMHALNFIIGAKADSNVVRKGTEKGAIEAIFEVSTHPKLLQVLENAGIQHEPGSDIIIRKEISSNGKSRAFINNQAAQMGLLRSVGALLVNIVGQHDNQDLLSIDQHRELIDLYGGLEEDVSAFRHSWLKENRLKEELQKLIASEAVRLREIALYSRELQEITDAALKEGEEEEVFAEYSLLASGEELISKVEGIMQLLDGNKQSTLSMLNKQKNLFEELLLLDSSLHETAKAFNNALLELQEISYTLNSYRSRIEYNPEKTATFSERLSLINQLKRKYGMTIKEIFSYQESCKVKLDQLENADFQIEELKKELIELQNTNEQLSRQLTEKRKSAAKKFETAIVAELVSLNMPKIEFHVEFSQKKRTQNGDDLIEFFLCPNIGERKIPVKECASGGELSRILLALQVVLSGREKIPTLVFDEIDANIGGKTASVIGEKLKTIGSSHQVICITHFPQVAKHANTHLQISKMENEGRTATHIQLLSTKQRQKEIDRMLGGNSL